MLSVSLFYLKARRCVLIGLFAIISAGCVKGTMSDNARPQEQQNNPLQMGLAPVSYVPSAPAVWELPNGVTVLHIKDDEIPLISASLLTRGGGLWETPEQEGVASVTGQLLRKGGVVGISPEELDLTLEKLSASISTTIGGEFGSFSFSCLKSDLSSVSSIFKKIMLEPTFEESKLNLHKLQLLEKIRRRKDDGATIAGLALASLLYKDSPYGTVLTSMEVKEITRAKVIDWHRNKISLRGAIFLVSGDISEHEVRDLANNMFSSWPDSSAKSSVFDNLPPLNKPHPPGVYFIEAPFSQATVVMGHLGVPRYTEDHFDIKVFNRIFGIGMGSPRLYQRIRSELGLAYSVSGSIQPGAPLGTNSVQLQTKAESAGVATKEVFEVIRDLQQNGVTSAELVERRRGVINSFVFANEDADSTLERQALFRLYGFPLDYDNLYVKKVEAVTQESVSTMLRSRWKIDEMVTVIVGSKVARNAIESAMPLLPLEISQAGIKDLGFDETIVFPDGSSAE